MNVINAINEFIDEIDIFIILIEYKISELCFGKRTPFLVIILIIDKNPLNDLTINLNFLIFLLGQTQQNSALMGVNSNCVITNF